MGETEQLPLKLKMQYLEDMSYILPIIIQSKVEMMELNIIRELYMDYLSILKTEPSVVQRMDFSILATMFEDWQPYTASTKIDCSYLKSLKDMYSSVYGKDYNIPVSYVDVISYCWKTTYIKQIKPLLKDIAYGERNEVKSAVKEALNSLDSIFCTNKLLRSYYKARTEHRKDQLLNELEDYRSSKEVSDLVENTLLNVMKRLQEYSL